MTNNLLMSYLSYSRENQRLYRYILENSSDNERALSYLICRDFENNRSRFYNRNRPGNTYRPVRNFYPERESNNVERIPTIIPSTFFNLLYSELFTNMRDSQPFFLATAEIIIFVSSSLVNANIIFASFIFVSSKIP